VAATNEKFHPRPSPNRAIAVAATLSTQSSEITERAMTSRPPYSATLRPIRSISRPTTSTSAYIPITWAPMIGNTL
jgi:hypothetical protein